MGKKGDRECLRVPQERIMVLRCVAEQYNQLPQQTQELRNCKTGDPYRSCPVLLCGSRNYPYPPPPQMVN